MRGVFAIGLLLILISFVGYRKARIQFEQLIPSLVENTSSGSVICCSGGGIRSATFCMGGLEALSVAGIYQKSTAVIGVSGGGYSAAAYQVMRWSPADVAPGLPDKTPEGGREWEPQTADAKPFALNSPETAWVRRHTQYA